MRHPAYNINEHLLTCHPQSTGVSIFNTVRGSVDQIPNLYPACWSIAPPDGADPDTLNCRVQWCPDAADVAETFSGLDGYFDLINMDCNPGGGGSGTDAWALQIFNNPDYEPGSDPPAAAKREVAVEEKRSHARHLPKRQAEGVSLHPEAWHASRRDAAD